MTPKNFQVGFLNVHVYGLVIAFAILIAWRLAIKRAHIYKIPKQKLESVLLLIPLVLGIVGGRLYHVADKWSYYQANLQLIIRVDQGGLGIWGALLGIFLGFHIVTRLQKINLLMLLDLLAPSLLLAQGIGRFGNYLNQEGYGPQTDLPWGILIGGIRVHPTFFYEMILDFLFAGLLMHLAPKFKKSGQIFGLYLISYGVIRFFVEFFRIDTAMIGNFKVAQILSVLVIIIGFYLFQRKYKILGDDPSTC